MTDRHVDSVSGSDTSPYETWAKAANTITKALSVWVTGDDLFIHGGATSPHRETAAAVISIGSNEGSRADLVPVHVVDNNSGSTYDGITDPNTSGAPLVETTTDNDNINIDFQGHMHGAWLRSAEDISVGVAFSVSIKATRCRFDFGWQDDAIFSMAGPEASLAEYIDCEFHIGPALSPPNENVRFLVHNCCDVLITGGSMASFDANNAVIVFEFGNSQPNGTITCIGVDMQGLATNTGYTAFMQPATLKDSVLNLINCRLPSTGLAPHSGTLQQGQRVRIINSDEDSGNLYRYEDYQASGDASTSTVAKRDWSDETESGITAVPLAYKITPLAPCSIAMPVEAWLPPRNLPTGSTTFTVELLEDYTTALQDDEIWMELYYLDTLARTNWTFDTSGRTFFRTAGSNLAAGTGLGNWTGTTTGFISVKLTATVTINRSGYFAIRVMVGKFESGKVLYVCPKVDIT